MSSESTMDHPAVGTQAAAGAEEGAATERREARDLRRARARAFEGWAAVPLRLMLGAGFLFHGLPKLYSGAGHTEFMHMLAGLGIPAPGFAAWCVGAAEVGGAFFILIGLLSRVSSLVLIVEMIFAIILVHAAAGFGFIHVVGMNAQGPIYGLPGYEVNLLYIAMLLTVFIGGPGKMSTTPRDAPWWVR